MLPLKRILPVLILAALGAGSALGYARWQAEPAAGLDIQTEPLRRGQVRRVVATSGTVQPLVTVEVGSQVSGQVREIYVGHSALVRQGQEIARIDPRTFESRLREAEAGLAVAEAGVALQRAGVGRAEADLRQSEREFRRAESLHARGSTSQATLDAALAALEGARAELDIAQAEVANAVAAVLQRQAAIEVARIDLDRTFIRSPIGGVVIERSVEVGQTVAASLSAPKLFTIAQDLGRIQIHAQVDEADMGEIEVGNEVGFTVDAFAHDRFTGAVGEIRLLPTTDQNVVTYKVLLDATNQDGRLLPGMTANVEILTGERADTLVVPNEALRYRPRGAAEALVRKGSAPEAATAIEGGTGTLWTMEPDGLLVSHAVALGLSDREVTEVLGPAPPEGSPVVVRARDTGS